MILLQNGTVIDGTGAAAQAAAVLIDGAKVKEVGQIVATPDMEVIDCTGLVICPGFIDVHSHADLEILQHRSEKVRQGVTSEVVGNCGFSLFPTLPRQGLSPTFNIFEARGEKEWEDAGAYFADVEAARSYTNVAALTGHSTLRAHVSGVRAGKLDAAEQQRAEAALARCLEQGSIGLSTGLNEAPGGYGDIDELVALCAVVRQYGAFYTSHLRDYKFHFVEAVEEALEIGRRADVAVQLSHLQAAGRKNWDKMDPVLEAIDRAVAEGVDVGVDAYPYVAGSCNITQLLPLWCMEGGAGGLLERLADAELRPRIAAETEENMSNDWQDILIGAVEGKDELVGKTVQDVADQRGIAGAQAAIDLLLENNGVVTIVSFNQSDENLRKVLTHPCTSIITDGLVTQGKPHPRTFGTYVKFLGEYVRDKGWLSLEEGVRKSTGLPAQRFGLEGRGVVAAGNWADLVVFSAEQIGTKATYQEPDLPPEGIQHVFVNGEWVLRQGALQEELAGQPLRNG